MYELTKNEKKLARSIISASIEKEFETGLNEAEIILGKWKSNEKQGRETFHKLRDHLNNFLKHLSRRYDDLSGSDYLPVIAAILRAGYITQEDIKDFSDQSKNIIHFFMEN